MSITSITLANGSTYNLVSFPLSSGAQSGKLGRSDRVALVESPYNLQTQTQAWAGADRWYGSFELPPLTLAQAAEWEGFLGELRGMLNVFQFVDPRRKAPLGIANAEDFPTVQLGNAAGSTQLLTQGWRNSTARLLLRGDRFQLGYRYHEVCDTVSSDGSGNATIQIWPSLREAPVTFPQRAALILNKPACLCRLAANDRDVSYSVDQTTRVGVNFIEVR